MTEECPVQPQPLCMYPVMTPVMTPVMVGEVRARARARGIVMVVIIGIIHFWTSLFHPHMIHYVYTFATFSCANA